MDKRFKKKKHGVTKKSNSFSFGKGTAICFILLICFAVFANSIGNQFVFDDSENIVTNQAITSLRNIPDILGLTTGQPLYRPVRTVSYTVDYFFSGLNPVGYHLFNIFYHGLASVFVYLIVLLLIGNARAAFFSAIIFAIHPIQTDSVTYLSGRRDILSGLFFLMGFYYFLKYRQEPRKKYIPVVSLCYVFAILSKEMAVTLPAIFFLYDFIRNLKEGTFFKRIYSALRDVFLQHKYVYVSLFSLAIVFTAFKVFYHNPSQAVGYYGGSFLNNMLTVSRVFTHYLQLLFFPFTLNADYSYNAFPASHSLYGLSELLSLAILLAIFVCILKTLTLRNKYFAFCGLWFFITLLPVSHIFPHHELLAEHYLYIPMFGFALMIALTFEKAFSLWAKRTRLIYVVFTTLVILLSLRSVTRNNDWKDDLTLWTKTVGTAPECARARNNLGRALNNEGEPSKAVDQFQQAIRIRPNYAEAYCNMGVAYSLLGLKERVRTSFERAVEINPRFAEAYYNLGLLYAQNEELTTAIELFKKAVQMNPGFISAHYNLGVAYMKMADQTKALEHFRRVLKLNPDPSVTEKTKTLLAKLAEQ